MSDRSREAADASQQVERLKRRFQSTGLINPADQAWQPKPTAGDYARALSGGLQATEDEVAASSEQARALWGHLQPDGRTPRPR